jgi:hypothetical protein
MDYVLLLWFTLALFSTGFCATIQRNHSEPEAVTVREDRSGKAILRDFLACGVARDVSCFLDVADVLVEEKKNDLLGEPWWKQPDFVVKKHNKIKIKSKHKYSNKHVR